MVESRAPASPRLWLWLAGYFLILLIPTGLLPLMESTEGRYGEIAWEMVASGNYLEPFFNGIKHFHKPPLTYWAIAAGYKLFGINDFGARFFGVVAACLAVAYLYRLALVLLGDYRQARDAALIFATSLLFLGVARIVATDIYLTCFTVMAQYYLLRRIAGPARRSDAPLYGLALGLGFLAKGPLIFLFTLLPFLLAKLLDAGHRRLFSWRETALAVATFALVALPWYIAVMIENPGLLYYFLKVQTVDRVASNRFRRYEPPWYFFYVFAGTFLPYIFFFLKGAVRLRKFDRSRQVLFLYVLVPFLIFTLAQSKQPTYILPFYGMAAILAAGALARLAMPRLRLLAVLVLLVAAIAPAVAGFVYPPARPLRSVLLLATIPALWLWWQALRDHRGELLIPRCAALLLLVTTVAYGVAAVAAPQMRGYEQMAQALNRLDPGRKLDVLVYRGFLPSLSLYRRHLTASAYGMEREVQFQENQDYRNWYLPTAADLQRYLGDRKELFVVMNAEAKPSFETESGYRCAPVYEQRKHNAYRCRVAADAANPGQE
ncbi:glycosyltransferase family 39 protein [Desulfuromonas carbonis]